MLNYRENIKKLLRDVIIDIMAEKAIYSDFSVSTNDLERFNGFCSVRLHFE